VLDGARAGDIAPLTSGEGVVVELSSTPADLPPLNLTDLSGRSITADALTGKVVLLNFWATWCLPCREEIPFLMALQERYPEQLAIIGVSVDERPESEVKDFVDTVGMNYPVAMSNLPLEHGVGGISAVPSTLVINREGRVVQRHLGLLDPRRTEHEVRLLSGLPTSATLELVANERLLEPDTSGDPNTIPDIGLETLTPGERAAAVERMTSDACPCGCGLNVAECRLSDPSCEVSLELAKQIVSDVRISVTH
jgi:thiol-disulfide isomerase/thioredoxin